MFARASEWDDVTVRFGVSQNMMNFSQTSSEEAELFG